MVQQAAWGEALGKEGVYIGNIFSRDLYLWDSFPDHSDLVRGYILEKYFVETNPKHKLAQLRAFGGLSGSEYESAAAPRFFERYLASPEFNDTRDFLLAYELQRRFFLREDQGQIQKVRSLAVRIQSADPKFKPMRDAVHNQISAGLLPQLEAYRDKMPVGSTRTQVDQLIKELVKLTAIDDSALAAQVGELQNAAVRDQLKALLPAENSDPVEAIVALGRFMVAARQQVASRAVTPDDARRLIDLNITASADLHRRGVWPPVDVLPSLSRLMNAGIGASRTVPEHREWANQLYALYARGRDARTTAAIVGEASLGAVERLAISFADRFESRFVAQGDERRSLEATMDIGWGLIESFPREELTRLSEATRMARRAAAAGSAGELS